MQTSHRPRVWPGSKDIPAESPFGSPVMVNCPSSTVAAAGTRLPLPACPGPPYNFQPANESGLSKSAGRLGAPQFNVAAAVAGQFPAAAARGITSEAAGEAMTAADRVNAA